MNIYKFKHKIQEKNFSCLNSSSSSLLLWSPMPSNDLLFIFSSWTPSWKKINSNIPSKSIIQILSFVPISPKLQCKSSPTLNITLLYFGFPLQDLENTKHKIEPINIITTFYKVLNVSIIDSCTKPWIV